MNKENKIKVGDIIEGSVHMNSSGSAYLISNELPKDIYLHSSKTNKALHLDTVKVEVIEGKGRAIEGRVIEIVKRFKTEFVGTLQVTERFAFLVPDSTKMTVDIFIPLSKLMGGKDGQKAVGRLTNWKDDAKSPNGEIIKVLGEAGDNDVEIHSIMEEYNLPYEFTEEVLLEADIISSEITQAEIDKRMDFRDILTCTIDSETARDLDDALSVRWVNGNIEIGVHIADVSYFIKKDSEIHKEILKRGTSIYLVDRVVPMIPPKLSNDLCSLNPHTDKLVYSFVFTLDQNAKIINQRFTKGIINSNYRLTYIEVQKVIEGGETHSDEVKRALLDLDKYAKKLRIIRSKNNPLTLKGSEIKFKLDDNNKPIGLLFYEQNDANFLIEEFMVLTNMRVCEFIANKGYTSIHRTHDKPDPTKLETLKTFVGTLGYVIDLSDEDNIKNELNRLLKESIGTTEENIIGGLVVRCMSKANYQTTNIGHYGLGLKHYVHVTSPIRRACDYLIHRQLNDILINGGYPIK